MANRKYLSMVGLAVLIILQLSFFAYRRRGQLADPNAGKTPLEQFLQSEYNVPVTDVTKLERSFSAVVSFAPLCSETSAVKEVTYDCRSKTSMFGTNGVALQDATIAPIEANVARKRQFYRQGADQVTVVEEVVIDDPNPIAQMVAKMQASKRVLAADGRYVEEATNALRKYFREIDPVFPKQEVTTGTTWEQRIAVDSRLNPGGECIRKFNIACMYERDGEKYARVSSFFRFRGYRPQSDGSSKTLNTESEDVLTYCSQEVMDICLSSGLVVEKGVVSRVYQESISTEEGNASGYPGLVTETTISEKLIESVGGNDKMQNQVLDRSSQATAPIIHS